MDVGAEPLGLGSGRRTNTCHVRASSPGAEPVPSPVNAQDGQRICAIRRTGKRRERRRAAARGPTQAAMRPKNRLTAFGPEVEKEAEGR